MTTSAPEANAVPNRRLEEDITSEDPTHVGSESHRMAVLRTLPWYRRPAIAWLLPFVFLVSIVFGILAASQDQAVIQIICKAHFRDGEQPSFEGDSEDRCNTPLVQALAAVVMSRISSLKSGIGIFTIGFYTTHSDRLGRKLLMYLTLIPTIFSLLLVIYMGLPSSDLSIAWLYADALVEGCLGAGSLLNAGLNSYVSDCTAQERRSLELGYVMVVLSVGVILGPGIGAYVIKATDDINSALVLAIIALIILILYTVALPESRRKEFIPPAILGRIVPSPDMKMVPTPYTLVLLMSTCALAALSMSGIATVFIPYSNLVYGWTTLEDGIYFGFLGAATLVVYVAVFPLMHLAYDHFMVDKKAKKSIRSQGPSSILPDTALQERTPLLQEGATNAGMGVINEVLAAEMNQATGPPANGSEASGIWKDLTFFVFGAGLQIVGHAIVPIFEKEAVLFIGKDTWKTNALNTAESTHVFRTPI
ncbi:major facilitator superfamily domain-containing protein [Gamsiella multidivaricata]|uniref:major facilitator superfamily domain-containing protein n=1 Tax=Gamsiella multidivaricata TaxID=101098 RepID=UPI002220DA53|nr:major facilitator superfamily domain-containing protein [Gamsiella multidivaricata]KAI7819968.1 major facilitator superfamily domain-containing protein [Gamsiella multidivaricata]